MKHIKNFVNKINGIIEARDKSSSKIKQSKGLLSPSKEMASIDQPKTEIDVIATFVQSIRQAREEIKNGNK
jgi:hypothetical protein